MISKDPRRRYVWNGRTNLSEEDGLDGLLRLLVAKLEQRRELRSLDNRWVELAVVQGELHDLRAALAVERSRRNGADSAGAPAESITELTQHREDGLEREPWARGGFMRPQPGSLRPGRAMHRSRGRGNTRGGVCA